MRRLICKDFTCKHNGSNNVCTKKIVEIDLKECQSYERGFHYYLQLVYRQLKHTNMIPNNELNYDLKLGLYYVMEIFDLGFCQREHGDWRWVMLIDENNEGLNTEKIINRKLNSDKLMKHYNDFNNGILPDAATKKEEPRKHLSLLVGFLPLVTSLKAIGANTSRLLLKSLIKRSSMMNGNSALILFILQETS